MNHFINALKRFAEFKGRSRRAEYWYFVLFSYIAFFIIGFISGLMGESGIFLLGIAYIAYIIPALAVAIRRMHDVGKSGWFILIPIYNLILALTAGETGPNKYGPDPKAEGGEIEDHLVDSEES